MNHIHLAEGMRLRFPARSADFDQGVEIGIVAALMSQDLTEFTRRISNDNLGQVRALTDALVTADATVVPRAVLAAAELTPVSRCADVALLKSAVPLPRDERTLREVQRLRLELAEIEATREVGRPH